MSKTAKAPDYTAAAEATAQSSKEVTNQQTWANRPTINTPWGTQSWDTVATKDPSTGQDVTAWTQNTSLNPDSLAALNSELSVTKTRNQLAEELTGRLGQEYGQEVDWSGFNDLSTGPSAQGKIAAPTYGDPVSRPDSPDFQSSLSTEGLTNLDPSSRYYDKAGDAIYGQWESRANKQFGQDNDALRTQLYNAGFKEGDVGYDREMEKLRQSQNDARQQASYQATIGAGSEAQRMLGMDASTRAQLFGERGTQGTFTNDAATKQFGADMTGAEFDLGQNRDRFGMDMQAAGFNADQNNTEFGQQSQAAAFGNQVRQQQISEMLQQRGWTLNEINAIMSGQQVGMPQMPSFTNAAASEKVDYSGAARDQYAAAKDAADSKNAMTQGLMSGASSMFMMSDRRLKRNITPIGVWNGIKFYGWDWIFGGRGVGVVADEVAHIPGAVRRDQRSGFDMVDYGVIFNV